MPHEPNASMRPRPAPEDDARTLTALIRSLGGPGDTPAGQQIDALFASLRKIAARQLRRQRPGHTLQPTALVNEAYLRMFGKGPAHYEDRHHFFKTAAAAMRTAIISHERHRRRSGQNVPFDPDEHGGDDCEEIDMLVLDDCLRRLQALDPDMAQIVELRVFFMCSEKETAAALKKPLRTVQREWAMARGWLHREFRRI